MPEKKSLSREEADRKQSCETRKKILNSAAQVFMQKDYHTATTKEIAEKAGVAKGSVFNHFKNKEELVYQTLKFIFTEMFNPMFEALAQLPPNEAIEALIDWTFDTTENSGGVVMLMLQLSVEVYYGRDKSDVSIAVYNELVELLEDSISSSSPLFEAMGFEEPRAASQLFFALLDGISAHQLLFKETRTMEQTQKIKDLMKQLFVRRKSR